MNDATYFRTSLLMGFPMLNKLVSYYQKAMANVLQKSPGCAASVITP